MGKNILQRLAEYLLDLLSSAEDAPPSAGGVQKSRKPRLTAIEGGKGMTDRDGNERRKPCAVIGIPYSSDAAEDKVVKMEESVRQ
jgi:hypothetical protein